MHVYCQQQLDGIDVVMHVYCQREVMINYPTTGWRAAKATLKMKGQFLQRAYLVRANLGEMTCKFSKLKHVFDCTPPCILDEEQISCACSPSLIFDHNPKANPLGVQCLQPAAFQREGAADLWTARPWRTFRQQQQQRPLSGRPHGDQGCFRTVVVVEVVVEVGFGFELTIYKKN